MAVKRSGLGKGLDSLIPEGKNVRKTAEKPASSSKSLKNQAKTI